MNLVKIWGDGGGECGAFDLTFYTLLTGNPSK